MTTEPLTYEKLIEYQTTRVSSGQLNAQTAANRVTALRTFLRANHVQEIDIVGSEMRAQHSVAIETMTAELRSLGHSNRSISNTRAAVTPWRQAVIEDDTTRALLAQAPAPFTTELQKVLGSLPIKRIARHAGIPADMLRGWTKGGMPRHSNAMYLRRLESFFGLQRNSLVQLAGIVANPQCANRVGEPESISYREKLGGRTRERYFLAPKIDARIREQWTALLRHKTDLVSDLLRSSNGRWTFSPLSVRSPTPATWWGFLDGIEVPTARIAWANIAAYLGWLALSAEKGGMAVPLEELDTLAWLAVPGYVGRFVAWQHARAGNKYTGAIFEFFAMMAWLLRPGDGYLFQLPAMQFTLPARFHVRAWSDMCTEQFFYCKKLGQALLAERRPGRNSFEPLNQVLQLHQPLEAVADMLQRMRRDRPVGSDIAEAIWSRDILLIKLLVSNPLRLRNIATLTWSPDFRDGYHGDNQCALYQRPDGSWWIYVPKCDFKNRRRLAMQDYDSPVHRNAWPDIERYIFRHRPTLMRCPTDLLFLAREHGRGKNNNTQNQSECRVTEEHRPFMDITRRVYYLTKRYLWKCDGIGMQAFRHIVATAILKTDEGSVKTAALVLNDRETTVEKHYSGLRSGDGAVRMAELLAPTLAKM